MAAAVMRVSLKRLLENARAVDVRAVSLCEVRAVSAVAESDPDGLKGECSTVKVRDDDVKALRQVCAAILRFADEPISIQTGSQEGAERRARELKGEKMVFCRAVILRAEDVSRIRLPCQELHQGRTGDWRQLHVHVYAAV